ncbi:hypothetical protein [Ruegeria atlantica]|uniref:hypothetical protein n=1 Tax=Ruegeria atlantica TaxID=81569 RepID=UPI001481A816|nr:hypothetical protein [Ruegeria atlantica]
MKPEGTEAHFVLPLQVYEKYQGLIDEVTNGEFNPHAMYNVAFLYTDPEKARQARTVVFGTEIDDLIVAYSNFMEKVAQEPNREEQVKMFRGAHSYFRSALCLGEPDGTRDPCASKNPVPNSDTRLAKTGKKKWWNVFGSA